MSITKRSFLEYAAKNGLIYRGSSRVENLQKAFDLIDKAPDVSGVEPDKCTVRGQHLTRLKSDGGESHLRLGKHETIYSYKNHFIVFSVHEGYEPNAIFYSKKSIDKLAAK